MKRFARALAVVPALVAHLLFSPTPLATAQEFAWTRQFGTRECDEALGVAVSGAGDVYVAGGTRGALPGQATAGLPDAFIGKYDADGNARWTRQFGSPEVDGALGVTVSGSDEAYV